ncbi:MFS transporter [Nocardioides insulae]|uniref:MFS transporter n=1 Tax=Nocardioides insulae TaxID=394734 RepID=UPI00048F2AB1|nr:MFS transporter [Nocardioides insulae]
MRRAPWWGIFGAVFVSSWGGNQFSPLLLMYEDRAHYSAVLVNLFLGVYVLGLAPALLMAGPLSDRHGRRPVLLAGLCAALVGSFLLAFGGLNPIFLAVGRLFSGVTVGVAMAVGNSWIKELSDPPYDPSGDPAAGARRASLAFTLGSGTGALVAGLIAQWGPLPEVLPFAIHLAVTAPFLWVVLRTPETSPGGVPGPWWNQLRVPAASHRRFTRVVCLAGPWIFVGAAVGYGYLPTRLHEATGSWGLVFATAAGAIALGISSLIQPLAKRLHSFDSARGLVASLLALTLSFALVGASILQQSVWLGLLANVAVGAGMGIGLVSGLLEVQRIAGARDLAGLTGRFYAVSYAGFLAPSLMAPLAPVLSVGVMFALLTLLAVTCYAVLVVRSRQHLPAVAQTQ